MSPGQEQFSHWRRVLALLLGVSIAVAGLAATSDNSHLAAHGGEDCGDGALCVVAMFGSGAVNATPTETMSALPPRGLEWLICGVEPVAAEPGSRLRPTARGPPVSFLFEK